MPSGAKRRKAANKKKKKDKEGGPNYPSSTHLPLQGGEDDSKSQDDRESDNGSPLSQENNDHQHPFDEENEAPERTDTPSVASDLTASKLSNAEDPAGGNIVVEDDERLVEVDKEVSILSSRTIDMSVASERKHEEDPSYALSSKSSPGIEEKALHSLAEIASQFLEVEKVVANDNGSSRMESVPTETAGFEQVMPLVEADKILTSSANDGNEEKGIEDAYASCSDAVSLHIDEKDVNPTFAEGTAQILLEKGSPEDANGDDVDVNPASHVDLDTPVVPMSDVENPVIDRIDSVEVQEVVEWRLSDNEEMELQEPSKVNGTSPTASGPDGKEGKIFSLEENNVEASLDEDKTLTSANEEGDAVFPLVDENGKSSPDGVDAVIADEDKMLTVIKEKEDRPILVGDDMIGSSDAAASATEIVNETKTETPGAGSVDNVSTVEASDVTVKGIEGMSPRQSDSGTEKAGIDGENEKDRSLSAGTQPPGARPTGLWALVMSCCGLSEVFGVSK